MPLTRPLLGSRRHCKAGAMMASNDFHLLMGSAKLSFSMVHVIPMHFVRVAHTCSLERYLAHWDADITSYTYRISRVLGRLPVPVAHCTIYGTLSVLQASITKLMAKRRQFVT